MRRLAFAPLLLAAACGTPAGPAGLSGGGPTTPPATTSPRPARPTTSTTPARPATSTTPARPAPSAMPTRHVANDVDGDGRPDRVTVTERGDSPATGLWTLTVRLASGTTVDGVVPAEPQVRPEVLGVADADADGDGEVFVRVGGGASTTTYTPYTLVEDGLAEVRTPDGRALRLVTGGSVTHGDGFACDGGLLVVLRVVSDGGTTFRGTRTTYRWTDDRVTEAGERTFTAEQGDAAVEQAYEVGCGGL